MKKPASQDIELAAARAEAYDMIDHHLRNTLDDMEYEEYLQALETIWNQPKCTIAKAEGGGNG